MKLPARYAINLGLVLHELVTNAAKYGALSTNAGRSGMTWSVAQSEDRHDQLRIHWTESGGPPVAPPKRQGFGSRLIRRSIEGELGGYMVLNFAEGGVAYDISVPLAHSARADGSDSWSQSDTPFVTRDARSLSGASSDLSISVIHGLTERARSQGWLFDPSSWSPMVSSPSPVLSIENLSIGLPALADRQHAIKDLSLSDRSGRDALRRGRIRLRQVDDGAWRPSASCRGGVRVLSGSIRLGRPRSLGLDEAGWCDVRGREVGTVFQEPMTSLNPVMRVADQIAETFRAHGLLTPAEREQARARPPRRGEPARTPS